jgi:bifunctional UDP-N-acetylglucosamine pyrophosphorylase/glucosamine-1-phosphate N-acetyltransferase
MSQIPVLVILAGGASSRMWPLREKSLMRFGQEPLLISQLRRYSALGFAEVILVGNPGNAIELTTMVAKIEGIRVRVVVQNEPKGMGDALLQAAPLLADRPEAPIYITQVHDVVDDRLHLDMLSLFRGQPQESFIAGYEMDDYFPGGYLVIDSSDRINGIVEKPGAENRPSNFVTIVAHIHRHSGRLMDAIRTEYDRDIPGDDHYERAIDSLLKTQIFRVVPYSGHWSALKYPWHVLDVMDYFLSHIEGQIVAEDAFVAKTATLSGNVFVSAGAKIFPGAAVVGPAYIGAGTIVGNNALVRHSMVMERCNVGFTTEVARSYVAEGCQMHACRVLDSVFAPNVNFSAGCTTANLRIDKGQVHSIVKGNKINTGRDKLGAIIGQDAFLSVDVMTMPGVKIGENAQVGPGTHVLRDVQNNQRIYVKQVLGIVDGD